MSIYKLGDMSPQIPQSAYVAPNAQIIGNVILGEDASVWFGVVIRGDNDPITVGARSNVQDGSMLHTDIGLPMVIGEDVTVGHMVMLHGCTIGDNSLIGMGAIVLNRAQIGKNTVVGAGALVPEGKTFPDGVLLMGSPARVVRELTPEQVAGFKRGAEHYVHNGRRYKAELTEL